MRHFQITVQGYNSDGSFEKANHVQDNFEGLEQAKERARELWNDFRKATALPFIQLFISNTEQQKTVFYAANFK